MPTIGDYVIIESNPVTLPKPNPPNDIDHTFPAFDASALNTGFESILAFQLNPSGDVKLKVTLNNTEIRTLDMSTDPARSWHEVVDAGVLKPSNNLLTIEKTAGSGTVIVSDLYMQFQANI